MNRKLLVETMSTKSSKTKTDTKCFSICMSTGFQKAAASKHVCLKVTILRLLILMANNPSLQKKAMMEAVSVK